MIGATRAEERNGKKKNLRPASMERYLSYTEPQRFKLRHFEPAARAARAGRGDSLP